MPDDLTPPARKQHGHSRSYILARLAREGRSDLVAAVAEGKISAYTAGETAKFFRRPAPLGNGSPNEAKRRRHLLSQVERPTELDAGKLSSAQEWFLRFGPKDAYDSAFSSEEAVIAAWAQHRERILADYTIGRRPWAWRVLDPSGSKLRWRGYDHERADLWRAGILGAAERIELERQWRKDFEKAHSPAFSFCSGPNSFLNGEAAKRAHFEWADVPQELVRRWTAERRQQKGGASDATLPQRQPAR
jgi:hypothetical protein